MTDPLADVFIMCRFWAFTQAQADLHRHCLPRRDHPCQVYRHPCRLRNTIFRVTRVVNEFSVMKILL